jgi:hypothetical protein
MSANWQAIEPMAGKLHVINPYVMTMCLGATHSSQIAASCWHTAVGLLGQATALHIKASGAKITLSWLTQLEASVGALFT